MRINKKLEELEETEPPQEVKSETDNQVVIINNMPSADEKNQLRAVSLYGNLTEQKASDVVSGLLYLESTSVIETLGDPEDPESTIVEVAQPIKFYISTYGGNALDMFSIYDAMNMIKKNTCEIETVALGKVMSAGVPLLAAGTKGRRKIGANCRVMLHGVSGGNYGAIYTLENELQEIKWIQDRYIACLVEHTNLTKKKLKQILRKKTDVYISAKDAIKYGIADEIV